MILHSFKQIPAPNLLPEKMNNPFGYEPHPLCVLACEELQALLAKREEWREEIDKGKMFGVLIVEKDEGIGYLAAYSGQIGGRSDWDGFVPAVFDYLQPDGYFKTHEAEISHLNHTIDSMARNPWMKTAREQIAALQVSRQHTLEDYQRKVREAKARRDARRAEGGLSAEEERTMTRESQFMKAELGRLKKTLAVKTELETEYDARMDEMARMRRERKKRSDALQRWLFSQFRMLNSKGESRDLLEIFRDTAAKVPPAGSGECCEPKLLQYAYAHGMRPLQMAMFWWGESPKEEIRHHLCFYPACNGKCKPILEWMLPDAIREDVGGCMDAASRVETLYEDAEMVVICKPAGMLSVPGKGCAESVYSVMRRRYPEATGPLVVHRLDMATSGVMVIAKTEFAYHRLQEQFATHRVRKRYVAIVCGTGFPLKGTIRLPLMPDYLDRPRQVVSHDHGKEAITEYEVLEEKDGRRRLALWPMTGRTHQLRVHCAHREGLDAPILGDPLYGNEKADRLYLHAEAISFQHPLTGEMMNMEWICNF